MSLGISPREEAFMNHINDRPDPCYNEIQRNIKKKSKYNIDISKNKVTHKIIPGIKGLLITSNGPKYVNESFIESRFPTLNKKKKTNSIFGSSEIRFKYQNIQTKGVGPGYYETENKKREYHRKIRIPPYCLLSLNDNLDEIKKKFKKDSTPPLGSYHTERFNTIQGELEKQKVNKIPFGILSKRFNYKVSKNSVGPGSYVSQSGSIKQFNCKVIPFNSLSYRPFELKSQTIKRNPIETRVLCELGPGKYKTESYFDWNKKSFNIKY